MRENPPKEYLDLIPILYQTLYKGQYYYIDYRKVMSRKTDNSTLGIRLNTLLLVAKMRDVDYVDAYIDNDEIVVVPYEGGKPRGVVRKISHTTHCGKYHYYNFKFLFVTNLLRAIGLKKGDWALVKVRKREIRISNPKKEMAKAYSILRILRGGANVE